MAIDIVIPEIGENVDSGEVVNILVSVGDDVEAEQGIIELETDKAVVEIPAPQKGRISEITVSEGDTVKTGQTIGKIESAAESSGAEDEGRGRAERDDIDTRRKLATPKSTEPSEAGNSSMNDAKPATSLDSEVKDDTAGSTGVEGSEDSVQTVPASPHVRRFARELGVDLRGVTGTGAGGRILENDVKSHVRDSLGRPGGERSTAPGASTSLSVPEFATRGNVRREPMNKVRQIIASGTAATWKNIPHVTQFDEANITELEGFVERHAQEATAAGGKLTITAILVKTIVGALKVFPRFNASIDMERQEIVYKDYYDIGIAVDTDRGLLIPVIRNADQKGIIELSVELVELAERAREKKTKPDELEGGTFTISNQGGIGGTSFTPIIYWPQVAILGVSRSFTKPVYTGSEFEPRTMLPLSLSYDHRVNDGADAARFLKWVCEALEQPFLIHL
jgi:pyruvate dehydrogenase E2 component (dihydrolipoamide acetyltransferase)